MTPATTTQALDPPPKKNGWVAVPTAGRKGLGGERNGTKATGEVARGT